MPVGILSGPGGHDWPRLGEPRSRTRETPYGSVNVTRATIAGVTVAHVSRHGAGHVDARRGAARSIHENQ